MYTVHVQDVAESAAAHEPVSSAATEEGAYRAVQGNPRGASSEPGSNLTGTAIWAHQ